MTNIRRGYIPILLDLRRTNLLSSFILAQAIMGNMPSKNAPIATGIRNSMLMENLLLSNRMLLLPTNLKPTRKRTSQMRKIEDIRY
jgi:hypothetical protein